MGLAAVPGSAQALSLGMCWARGGSFTPLLWVHSQRELINLQLKPASETWIKETDAACRQGSDFALAVPVPNIPFPSAQEEGNCHHLKVEILAHKSIQCVCKPTLPYTHTAIRRECVQVL